MTYSASATTANSPGVFYDPNTRSWNVVKQKTDYQTEFPFYEANLPTNLPTDTPKTYVPELYKADLPFDLPTNTPLKKFTVLRTDYPTNLVSRTPILSWDPAKRQSFVTGWRSTPDTAKNTANERLNKSNAEINLKNEKINEAIQLQNLENARINQQNYEENLRREELNAAIQEERNQAILYNEQIEQQNLQNAKLNLENQKLNEKAEELNRLNEQQKIDNQWLNFRNNNLNDLYDRVLAIATRTKGGDYVTQRDQINERIQRDLINTYYEEFEGANFDPEQVQEITQNIEEQFKLFYRTEKITPWNTDLGAKPPYGDFDPLYYKEQNPAVAEAWEKAVAEDDLDIIERYGENNFYWQHYTNVGSKQGLRGNLEEDLVAAEDYEEEAVTDKEIQDIRDLQLGVDTDTITQRLLNIPQVSNEWTKARQGDPYWQQFAKQKYLDINKPEEFAVLFRLSERPQDKQIILRYNVNAGTGITEIEEAINNAISTRKTVDVKKFAALNQTILKDAISELKKQKSREQMMSFYRGFEGFAEVADINYELSNSILGDSGIGGILSLTSGDKAEKRLLGALEGMTGIRNNIAYNWQQWFDRAIKNKYGIDYSLFEPLEEKKDVINAFLDSSQNVYDANNQEFNKEFLGRAGFKTTQDLINFLNGQGAEGQTILNAIQGVPGDGTNLILQPLLSRIEADIKTLDETKARSITLPYSTEEATELMNIDANFARSYLDEYLIPRFDESKSMDEFVEYLDISQKERNPFEIADLEKSLKEISQLRSDLYLDQIKSESARGFDPEFYFNPVGDTSRLAKYATQKQTIEKDWELAKKGDPYWSRQVYRFGIDVNDKAAFARMHFEVKGQGLGYDAAEDIVNAGKVKDFISMNVIPLLEREANKPEVVFGTFITPEEFATEILAGLDPVKTPEAWKQVLDRMGLNEFKGTIDELKGSIAETLRGGSATQIREQIKFLNARREKPTQEILGITYIPKTEDYSASTSTTTTAKPTTQLYAIFQKAGYQGTEDDFYQNMFPDLDRSEQVLLTKAGLEEDLGISKLNLRDPFAALTSVESFFPEDTTEEESKTTARDSYDRYFRISQGEEEEEPSKTASGQSFLNEFTSFFKGL